MNTTQLLHASNFIESHKDMKEEYQTIKDLAKGYQLMASRVAALEAQNKILAGFTSVWLDEFEGQWDNDEKCASIEIAEHYITCATYMKRAFQRDYGRYVEQVQDWIDGQFITPWEH